MRTRLCASLVVVCALITLAAAAQDRGTIRGLVVDAHGAVLPGVTVTLEGLQRRSTITDDRGEFEFAALPLGQYRLRRWISSEVSIRA
jgi:hypothetical protein